MEVKPNEQIVIKVDWSRRLMLGNRRFVRELDPRETSLKDQHLMTNGASAPTPRPGKTRQLALTPPTWTPPSATTTTPPQTAPSTPMQPEQTRYEAPLQISDSSRSTAEIPVNHTDPSQDREQGTHSHGQEDGAEDAAS